MLKKYILLAFVVQGFCAFAQKEVAITIDDVPNAQVLKADGFTPKLLGTIDRLALPVTIFINEGNLYLTPHVPENFTALLKWIDNKNITAGNHTYAHSSYSKTSLPAFRDDVVKGEAITQGALKQRGLPLRYFRFPFNDLGNDSAAHAAMATVLAGKGYTIAPFTIESSDWAYSALYDQALAQHNAAKARAIGQAYVAFTLKLFTYFEQLAQQQFGHPIRHIYLCHDNALNRDYLDALTGSLKQQGYSFISLDEALKDKVYATPDYYYGSAGFSWIYRWEKRTDTRKAMLRAEPEDAAMLQAYEQLQKH